MNINVRHPEYNLNEKYRLTFEGGRDFINKYLYTFSKREDGSDFQTRKNYTYCPAHAKIELLKIKNAIYQRLGDIIRLGGPASYQEAAEGLRGGVDRQGGTITNYVGSIIPELLAMGKVGIFVDRPTLSNMVSRADILKHKPYVYTYKSESILSWAYADDNTLSAVLLQDSNYDLNDDGLPSKEIKRYRYLNRTDNGIIFKVFDESGQETASQVLDLENIPFILLDIKDSILKDVADYQVALLNMGSSDVSYALKSNFPFYTEQYDLKEQMHNLLKEEGEPDEEVKLGTGQGRKYAKGLDRPQFVNPSPEPLRVSMEKQQELRLEIKQLMQMSLENLDLAEGTVDSGLAFIGSKLEQCERELAKIWSDYEKTDDNIIVKYPVNYTLKSDADRRKEASEIEEQISKTPSPTLKKELAKQVANTLVGSKVSRDEIDSIHNEIDTAKVIVIDPDVIREDHEAGFVGTELASELRGYPPGEVEKAKEDHAQRAMRIAAAQSSIAVASASGSGAARGLPDNDVTPLQAASDEKTASRNTDLNSTTASKVRGEGA